MQRSTTFPGARGLPRRTVLHALAAATTLPWSVAGAAEPWPAQPLKMIVPQGTGGGVDTMGRILAKELGTALGVPVIVENKPGGAANIGAEYVAKAQPDGYVFLYGFQTIATTNPHLYNNLRFNARRDLLPVTQTMVGGYILSVNNDLPVRTLPELVAYAKKNPGKLAYGSYGTGSAHHLLSELLSQQAGIQMVHVPYKQTPQVDLVAGNIQVLFEAAGVVQEFVRAGKVRAIAISSEQRLPSLPDLPTLSETFPGLVVTGWQGVWLPRGTPAPIVERLNRELVKILRTPAITKIASDFTATVTATSPAQMQAIIELESRMWGDVIKAKSIRVD